MIPEIDLSEILKPGRELTVDHDIIDGVGSIIFTKGQKVTIDEVWKDEAHWSNIYEMYMPTKIHGFKLIGHYGLWFTGCFEETKDLK